MSLHASSARIVVWQQVVGALGCVSKSAIKGNFLSIYKKFTLSKRTGERMHYTYLVECRDHTFYIGYTNNLEKRIKTHNAGKGAKYTRGRLPVLLRYYEEYETKSEALKRECELKKLKRKEKERLVEGFSLSAIKNEKI